MIYEIGIRTTLNRPEAMASVLKAVADIVESMSDAPLFRISTQPLHVTVFTQSLFLVEKLSKKFPSHTRSQSAT